MPIGFTNQDFLDTYKQCYSHIWRNILQYCHENKCNQLRRKRNKYKTIPCYSAVSYLLRLAKANICNYRNNHNKGKIMYEEERETLQKRLISHARNKEIAYGQKLRGYLSMKQEVCPSYVRKLIDTYFSERRKDALDINARFLILLEASLFVSRETIEFLYKINSCEKNDALRQFAFYSLQSMGEYPWLARKRKGKSRLSKTRLIDIKQTPTALLQVLYSHQHMLYQQYDVFLSHSSLDVNELLCLKRRFNKQGYVVYIDWINDRIMLNRENQDENTWPTLELRMRQSLKFVYVLTANSVLSESTQREVVYFKSLGKPIFYYKMDENVLLPEYLKDCCLEYKFSDDLSST